MERQPGLFPGGDTWWGLPLGSPPSSVVPPHWGGAPTASRGALLKPGPPCLSSPWAPRVESGQPSSPAHRACRAPRVFAHKQKLKRLILVFF